MLRLGALLGVWLAWPGAATADDIDVELRGKVIKGTSPALVLHLSRDVSALHLSLTASVGRPVSFDAGPTRAGRSLEVPLPAEVGKTRYTGKLAVSFAKGGKGEMPLGFEVEVLAPLEVRLVADSLDLAKGRAAVTLSRPAARCEVEALLDDKPPRRAGAAFAGEAPGTPLWLSFPVSADDVVLKLRFECWDTADTFNTADYPVWKLEVPHEDVNFATGDSRIADSELPKVDRAYEDIATAIRRYGKIIPIRLYVVGHTDTVGDAGSNQRLSEARARSIAQALRQRGVSVPVSYAGFGESALLVPTADETAEGRNRRAQYILAVDPPLAAGWQKL